MSLRSYLVLISGKKILASAAVASLACVLAVGSFAPSASAVPGDAEVTTATAELQRIDSEVGSADEQYTQAKAAKAASEKRVEALKDDLNKQEIKVAAMREQAAEFARATYQNGGVDTTTALFVSGDPDSFLNQVSTAAQVDDNMNAALQTFQAEQANLTDLRRAADAELAKAAEAEQRMAEQKRRSEQNMANAQAVLNRLSPSQRAQADGGSSIDPSKYAGIGANQSSSAIGSAAAAYARAHVGAAYVRAAEGPGAFDCSGLTLAAYRSAGVSLPHFAASQMGMGRPVGLNELSPGDLIFYGYPASHVAIYVGDGIMVHARNPRVGVVIQSVASYPSKISGARRLIG